jgi:hypothetical protein
MAESIDAGVYVFRGEIERDGYAYPLMEHLRETGVPAGTEADDAAAGLEAAERSAAR